MVSIPQITKPQIERKPQVHTIGYSERVIEKDGFNVLVDAYENILTDMELLGRLRTLRSVMAQECQLHPYCIMQNDTLVLLATDKPITREEFIRIKGIGNRKYERFGERFIAAIKEYTEL